MTALLGLAALVTTLVIAYLQRRRILALEAVAGYQEARMDALLQVLHGKSVLAAAEGTKLVFVRLCLLDNDETPAARWRMPSCN